MQGFRRLRVWQKANELSVAVYGATSSFPADERFGLTSQLHLSRNLGYLEPTEFEALNDGMSHVRSMLIRLLFKLRVHRPQN